MMHRTQAAWVSTLIAALCVGLLVLFSPGAHHTIGAIFLPATAKQPVALPQSTQLVQWAHKPQNSEPVGHLHLERPYYLNKTQDELLAHNEIESILRKYLLAQGANAFFVEDFHVSRVVGKQYIYVFKAVAYRLAMPLQVQW